MGKPKYLVCNIYSIEENEKQGYELREIIYETEIIQENCSEQVPQILTWTSTGTYNNPPSPPSPQYTSKIVPVPVSVAKALMVLTAAAQVLHGD